MNKINKVMLLLVISLLTIFSFSEVKLEATEVEFDNSQFVSELTEEEIEQQEIEAKELDFATYMERIQARPEYRNFSSYQMYIAEDGLQDYKQKTYDNMAKKSYTQNQKNEYYNLMLGDELNPGLTDYLYEFEEVIRDYQDSDMLIDCNQAIVYFRQLEYPAPTIDNVEFIELITEILIELPNLMVEVDPNTATKEERAEAQQSNIIFTAQINGLLKNVSVYSMPKATLLQRVSHSSVIMNIGMIVGVIILFVVRFPVVKKQQEYAWGKFKPLSLLSIPLVGAVFFALFSFMFSVNMPVSSAQYSIYLDDQLVTSSERIYLDKVNNYKLYVVASGSDNSVSSVEMSLRVTDDMSTVPQDTVLRPTEFGYIGNTVFTTETGGQVAAFEYNEDPYAYVTVSDAFRQMGFSAEDTFEPDELLYPRFINYRRNEFILPYWIAPIWPAMLFGTLYFMFMLMPGPMVKMYLDELYTINKFCGFLSYNMAYRSNARVLIEETLQSLDACKFAEDFAIIFFEKNRNMTDKIQDVSQIYSYKFFEMYLGIVNIIFDEGVSDSTLKSLSIIQQFGDEYYNQADMFFKSKKGARGSLMMIIFICMAMPIMVRKNTADMFLIFIQSATGYTFTVGCYLVWFGIICAIYNMYKNNKIVRQEGRYA